ncbi:MAG TPA: hypothetical protein VE093_19005 [Polyangiaceae bacterium]|nr:hypothetical protein [Polyangiaceae bacterium]
MRHDGAIANVQAFSDVRPLVNVPVLSQEDPSLPGRGVPFFRELFERRVADLGAADVIAPGLLDKLAYYSGGRAREFVVFIRRLAELAWDADVTSATAEIVDRVLDERRRLRETGMNRRKIRLLESVVADPDHRLPEGEDVNTLLTTGALLPYPDGSEWYYPHPLLMMKLVQRRPAGSTS